MRVIGYYFEYVHIIVRGYLFSMVTPYRGYANTMPFHSASSTVLCMRQS